MGFLQSIGDFFGRIRWNVAGIAIMVFVIWHALYLWILNGIVEGNFKFGDDATVGLLTVFGSVTGLLMTVSKKFAADSGTGNHLRPNLLFLLSIVTVMTLEILTMAAKAVSMGALDLKGVVIGVTITIVAAVMTGMLGVMTTLLDDEG